MEINDKLYTGLKKFTGYQPVNLFNSEGDFVEVVPGSKFKFIVPVGLFSSSLPLPKALLKRTKSDNYVKNISEIIPPELYPLQTKVVSEISKMIKQKTIEKRPIYITLHLACGFGKTITTCYLITSHKRRTVICVPNKMLIQQWKMAVHTTKIDYMISTEGVSNLLRELEHRDPDILIVVSRHLSNDSFCNFISKNYDLFILDESHTYNLMNNSSVTRFLAYYPPKICYFLTATPRYSNRIYCNDSINVAQLSRLCKILHVVDFFFESYSTEKIRSMVKKLDTTSNKYHIYTEKVLAEDEPRNKLIVDTVSDKYRQGVINRILIVTKLREHMMNVYDRLSRLFGDEVYLGDAQNRNTHDMVKDMKTKNKFIFISTVFYSGTGLDIPSLDSLIVCSVVMNSMQMEQLLGRICRETTKHNERNVFIFPTTSIKEIRHTIGTFSQRLISLALDKLGFEKAKENDFRQEKTLSLAFRKFTE